MDQDQEEDLKWIGSTGNRLQNKKHPLNVSWKPPSAPHKYLASHCKTEAITQPVGVRVVDGLGRVRFKLNVLQRLNIHFTGAQNSVITLWFLFIYINTIIVILLQITEQKDHFRISHNAFDWRPIYRIIKLSVRLCYLKTKSTRTLVSNQGALRDIR